MSTPTNRPGNEAQLAIEPGPVARPSTDEEPRRLHAAKRFAFPIILIVACFGAWAWLYTAGQGLSGDAFAQSKYPARAALAVAWFGVVIMAYPAYKAATRLIAKRTNQFELIRLGFMLATVLIGFWATESMLMNFREFGVRLWGLVFLGGIALVFHAAAAYLLTRYKADDQEVANLEASLPDLERNARTAKADANLANRKAALYKTKAKGIQAEYERLADDAKVSGDRLNAAQDAYNNNKDVKKLTKQSDKLTTAESELETLRRTIPEHEALLAREKDLGEKKVLQAKLDKEIARRTELRDVEIPKLEKLVKNLKTTVKGCVEELELTAAKATNKRDNKLAEKKLNLLNKVEADPAATAEVERDVTAELASETQAELRGTTQQLKNIRDLAKKLWRDGFVQSVGIPMLLWAAAYLMYNAWEGWVATEFFVVL